MADPIEPTWSYWCPPEGDHYIHPQELQVGIVSVDDSGCGRPLLVAAVIPPVLRHHGEPHGDLWHQNEAFARLAKEALEREEWNTPDGFAAGLRADGVNIPFPKLAAADTEGSE